MPRTAATFCLRLTEATELHDHSCTDKKQKHGQRCFLSKTSPKYEGWRSPGRYHLHSQRKNDEVACLAGRCIVRGRPRFWNVHFDPTAVGCKTKDRRDFARLRLFTLQCGAHHFSDPEWDHGRSFWPSLGRVQVFHPVDAGSKHICCQSRSLVDSVARPDGSVIKRAHWLGTVESSWNRPCVPIILHKYRHEPDMHNLQTQRLPRRRESTLSRPSHGSLATGTCRMLYQ
jgi:hypothetical protein